MSTEIYPVLTTSSGKAVDIETRREKMFDIVPFYVGGKVRHSMSNLPVLVLAKDTNHLNIPSNWRYWTADDELKSLLSDKGFEWFECQVSEEHVDADFKTIGPYGVVYLFGEKSIPDVKKSISNFGILEFSNEGTTVVVLPPKFEEAVATLGVMSQPAAVPEGYKLVPIEPTAEMVEAAVDDFFAEVRPPKRKLAIETYKAMLAAAPGEVK
jgi:hypothetical protein